MFGEVQIHSRLRSKKSFIKTSEPITEAASVTRLKKWKEQITDRDRNTLWGHPTKSRFQNVIYRVLLLLVVKEVNL